MKFYTSDHHFDHSNIIKFSGRPWDNINDMNEALISKWNAKVSSIDDVYILGDFCMNKSRFIEHAGRLNGIKHFIAGNHDPKLDANTTLKKCIFHPPIHQINDNGKKIILSHYPMLEWNSYWHGAVHFHGHCHGNLGANCHRNAFDVGVDCRDYEPKTYDEIVADNFVKFTIHDGHSLITDRMKSKSI